MVVEQILAVVLAEVTQKPADHVSRRGLEHQKFLLLYLAHLLANLPVKWQQQSVVALVRPNERIRILPEIAARWLVDDVISDHVLLTLEVLCHFDPHINEPIIHAVLVGEEIMGEADHIIGDVVLEEGFLHAVLLQRIAG